MKEINFRIIELENHQVLLQKDFDNEDDELKDLLIVTFYLEGIKVTNSYGYENEQNRDNLFNNLTNEQAQSIVSNSLNMFN